MALGVGRRQLPGARGLAVGQAGPEGSRQRDVGRDGRLRTALRVPEVAHLGPVQNGTPKLASVAPNLRGSRAALTPCLAGSSLAKAAEGLAFGLRDGTSPAHRGTLADGAGRVAVQRADSLPAALAKLRQLRAAAVDRALELLVAQLG